MTCKTGKALSLVAMLLLAAAVHAQDKQDTQLQPNPLGAMRDFEPSADAPYELGPGDEISVDAIGRPELTGKHVIGPDGTITVPIAGAIPLAGLTRDQAAGSIEHALDPYYTDVVVSVSIEKYTANQIIVMGAVAKPGVINFEGQPTLLEAIARASSASDTAPAGGQSAAGIRSTGIPDEVTIYRGNNQMLSVRLRALVEEGSPMANMRLRRSDLVYVSGKTSYVVVLGQVTHPGNLRLEPNTKLEDLIAQAGGPTEKAGRNPSIEIIHQNGPNGASTTHTVPFSTLLHHNSIEYTLQSGDIIYIPESGFNGLSYTFQALAPLVNLLTIGTLVGGQGSF
jgi:polysaccharide export outer membrane protein